jgi:hypothetical protein
LLYSAVGQAPIFRIIMKSDFVPYLASFPSTPERLELGLYKGFMGAFQWFKNGYENILRLTVKAVVDRSLPHSL